MSVLEITTYWSLFKDTCMRFIDKPAVVAIKDNNEEIYTFKHILGVSICLYRNMKPFVATGECIGIFIKRFSFTPSFVAAIQRCGCSFAFIDPNEDINVNIQIVKDFQIKKYFSLTSDILFDDGVIDRIDLSDLFDNDDILHLFVQRSTRKELPVNGSRLIAYCTKSSGSSSIQKNIMVPHTCILPNIYDLANMWNVNDKDVIYFSTPLTFDPSMVELYLAAYTGAVLLICEDPLRALHRDGNLSITIWQTTPSLFLRIGKDFSRKHVLCPKDANCLKVLALGGESFNFSKLLDYRDETNETEVYNLYGITEVSCWASAFKVNLTDSANICIGHPLTDTLLRITPLDMNSQNQSTFGDIEIGSSTRKCFVSSDSPIFVESVLIDKEILWQETGDLGEKNEDGDIIFRGRKDRLVKRFGRKVNLLEIENAALTFGDVQQAACVWLPKYHSICLVVVGEDHTKDKLTEHIQEKLSPHSLPDLTCVVKEIPLSKHGKVVTSMIYDLYESQINESVSAEFWLFSILRENLQLGLKFDDIAMKSFVDVGGNSIIAMQIINKIENLGSVNIPELFQHLMNPKCSIQKCLNYVLKHFILSDIDGKVPSNLNDSPPKEVNTSLATVNKNLDKLDMHDDPVKEIKVKWRMNLFKCIDAAPVLYCNPRGNLYVLVGSHAGTLVLIRTRTKVLSHIWHLDSRIEAPVCVAYEVPEPMCVVGCHDGTLWCFSLVTPYVQWWITPLEAMIKSQSCYLAPYVYTATYEGVIWQIDLKSGEKISSILVEAKEGISADLVTYDNKIFAATIHGTCACVQVAASGMKIKWKCKLSSPVFAKPTLLNNNSEIIFCEAKGIVHCLDTETGCIVWKFTSAQGSIFSSCVPYSSTEGERLVFGCHDQHTYHIVRSEDSLITVANKLKHTSEVFATPCIYKDAYIVCVATNGHLQIIDMETKNMCWEVTLPGEVFSSPVTSGDDIFVGCRDNFLYCLNVE